MTNIISELIKPNSNKSSSRAINLAGFIIMSCWITWQVYTHELTYDILAVYATYCSATYAGGKYIGTKKESEDAS